MAHALVRVKLCSGVRTAQTWNVLGQVYPPGLVPGLGGGMGRKGHSRQNLSISISIKINLHENGEKSSCTVQRFFFKKKSFTFGFVPERSTLI